MAPEWLRMARNGSNIAKVMIMCGLFTFALARGQASDLPYFTVSNILKSCFNPPGFDPVTYTGANEPFWSHIEIQNGSAISNNSSCIRVISLIWSHGAVGGFRV